MSRFELKHKLHKIFQGVIKNLLSLGDDSTLESDLKPIKVGDKTSPLELSETEVNVRGTINAEAINVNGSEVITEAGDVDSLNDLSDVTYSSGDLTITSLDKIIVTGIEFQVEDGEFASFKVKGDASSATFLDIGCEDGNVSQIKLNEAGGTSTDDYFSIATGEHGATTLATNDAEAEAANLTLDVDGDIELNADGGNVNIKDQTVNMATIAQAAFYVSGGFYMKERASAESDNAGQGQLWTKSDSPNTLYFTDDAGNDNNLSLGGKYQWETKFIGYYANGTTAYLPMTGYVLEGTTSTSRNEYQGFCAPYNGTIEKVTFRSEVAQDGNISFRVLEASDGTEIPTTLTFRKETAVDIADDIYQELDMTGPSVGSDYAPLTKGRLYQLYLATPSAGYDTNVTIVYKWDVSS